MTGVAFQEYAASYLRDDFQVPAANPKQSWNSPYEALRGTTDIETMRSKGTFFTGATLASQLWRSELEGLKAGAVILDPAGGAGDLLLPVATEARERKLSIALRVNDIESSFLGVAAKRLAAAAGPGVSIETTESNFLTEPGRIDDVTHVALNPPFIPVTVDREWAKGKVNAAAVFVDEALGRMPAGSVLLALLPDVLRSGSRYAKWRRLVEERGRVMRIDTQDVFDEDTDVHVFLAKIIVGAEGAHASWAEHALGGRMLGDVCEVRVGPVVPHRDEHEGPVVPFVSARNLTSGVQEKRAFAGRLERGPMILVNRTSRPGDRPRIRARVRVSKRAAAVENHLLVVRPRENSGVSTDEILAVLRSTEAADFLDNRIRCRHLTVTSLKEIPWRT